MIDYSGVVTREGGRTRPAFARGTLYSGYAGDIADAVFFESHTGDIYAAVDNVGSYMLIPYDQRTLWAKNPGDARNIYGALELHTAVASWDRIDTEQYNDGSVIADPDTLAWIAEQRTQFMAPSVESLATKSDVEIMFGDEYDPETHTMGVYARLSANGYIDATDWRGPYATIAEALQSLCDAYADA